MGLLAVIFLTVANIASLPILEAIEAKKVPFNMHGFCAPVFTPVVDGYMNLDCIGRYGQLLFDNGVDSVLVAGPTGEGLALSVYDKKNLIDAWVKIARQLGLCVMVLVNGGPLPDALELARYADEVGVNAILCMSDLFYKPKTAKELVYYLQFIATAAPNTPLLYYDFPAYTCVNVDMEDFFELATSRILNFVGVKTGNYETALRLQNKTTGNQRIFIADSLFLESAILTGFNSFIMVEINYAASLMILIVKDGQGGNRTESQAEYKELLELTDVITEDGKKLAAQKEIMSLMTGINMGPTLPPQMPLSKKERHNLYDRLRRIGIKTYNYRSLY